MLARIKALYATTKNKEVVANAVKKGYITAENYALIVGEEYKDE